MNGRTKLNLNLASRPRRNRRLFAGLAGALFFLAAALVAGSAFVVLRYGGEAARLKSDNAKAQQLGYEADREQRRLTTEVRQQERLNRTRIDLVNSIIQKKTFPWTALFRSLEEALPASSFITALSPGFAADGSLSLRMRVTSRGLDDLTALIDALNGRGFKNIQVFGETRSEDGRLVTEISLTYERAL